MTDPMPSPVPVADRPYRSLKITFVDRFGLRHHAKKDARRWLPDTGSGEPWTPTYEELHRHCREVIEAERLSALDDTASARQLLVELRTRFATVDGRGAVSPPVEPSPDDLSARARGEERACGQLVADRRTRRHLVKMREFHASQAELAGEELRLGVRIAGIQELIVIREQAARWRAHRFYAHTHRRIAYYLRSLARRHDDGAGVIAHLARAKPPVPDWVAGGPLLQDAADPTPTRNEGSE